MTSDTPLGEVVESRVPDDRAGRLVSLLSRLAERDREIARLKEERETDRLRAEAELAAVKVELARVSAQRQALLSSTSWRLTRPLRLMVGLLRKDPDYLAEIGRRLPGLGGVLHPSVAAKEAGTGQPAGEAVSAETAGVNADAPFRSDDYDEWVRRYDCLDEGGRDRLRACIRNFSRTPKISVLMPVFDPPLQYLDAAIQSVRNQLYPCWELCVADDCSRDPAVRQLLLDYEAKDTRIKLAFRDTNGHIARASNTALEMATGDYVALLDHDDLLAEQALFWVVQTILEHPDAGLIYSDEDKVSACGSRYAPYFKCDFNWELLLAQNMISHLGVYRRDILEAIGGFREGFEGSQDYDLALRVVERLACGQVRHIPRVLYHWRAIPGSTALSGEEKSYAIKAARRAVAEHLERQGIAAEVVPAPAAPGYQRVRFRGPDPSPLVSVIIPTRDRVDLLATCLSAISNLSTYPRWEIVIVDNGSRERKTAEYLAALPREMVRVVRDEGSFNFSRLNNLGVRTAQGELLCLMNNDVEVLSRDWMEEMVSFASRPEIGCVGARLWYPDGRIQHAGVFLGYFGIAGHSHKYLAAESTGYFGRAVLHQTVSAVTGAALMVRRSIYEEVGGLDEGFAVAFNDVDFCLRVRDADYRNVWTPYAEMIHHESVSRGPEDSPEKMARFKDEIRALQDRWGDALLEDPAYSPNLTLDYEDFSLAWPPRVR